MPRLRLDLSEVRPTRCVKCNRKGHALFRHHKGNDAFLARFNRQIGLDYDKYLDCVYLCNRDHMVIHFIYEPICQAWENYSPKGAWRLRAKLIDLCDLWLAGKIANPVIPKEYRVLWQRSFQAWQRSNPRVQRFQPNRTSGK